MTPYVLLGTISGQGVVDHIRCSDVTRRLDRHDAPVNVVDAPCAWLTTLRRDGSPHTTPVWFLLLHETFWITSSTVNVKVRNLEHDPRVSLALARWRRACR